jgi:hypothetical protein
MFFRGGTGRESSEGHYRVGICLRDAIGTTVNLESATNHFKTATDGRHRLAREAYDQLAYRDLRQVRSRTGCVIQRGAFDPADNTAGREARLARPNVVIQDEVSPTRTTTAETDASCSPAPLDQVRQRRTQA